MADFIYGILESVGFFHPLHPAVTHIPMGMVIGCFIFGLLAWLYKKNSLWVTAFHCSVLALVFLIPTVFTGYLDWQYRWGGEWHPLIIAKMVLAFVLLFLLAVSLMMQKKNVGDGVMFFIFVLCPPLCCRVGIFRGRISVWRIATGNWLTRD